MEQHSQGVDLPRGADVREMPRGLTDYLRSDSRSSTVSMQSHQLGIDLPPGANVLDLPRGMADYGEIAPGSAFHSAWYHDTDRYAAQRSSKGRNGLSSQQSVVTSK
jgi:hypothetical protein